MTLISKARMSNIYVRVIIRRDKRPESFDMKFYDRNEAGLHLADLLFKYKGSSGVVLGIPRGGVPVAAAIAAKLQLPLDLALVRKIGHPSNREYAIGAAGLDHEYIPDKTDIPEDYIKAELSSVRKRLGEMEMKFLSGRKRQPLKGKTVIIADDGIATGKTMAATVNLIRKQEPEKIIVAAPVISDSAESRLKQEADEVVSIMVPSYFSGVGAFYINFGQMTDEEVIDILKTTP
jgi:putative phosphoribosyl transferase